MTQDSHFIYRPIGILRSPYSRRIGAMGDVVALLLYGTEGTFLSDGIRGQVPNSLE
jgi:hypothetical protein